MPNILIIATSGQQYGARREGCRLSWLQDQTPHVEAIFGMSRENGYTPQHPDEVTLECHDSYNFLPERTRALCGFALGLSAWDYLLKCDDDTYVQIPRLQEFVDSLPPETHYVGNECWNPPRQYASGGAGYLLSRKAAEIVANHLTPPAGYEDLLVGRLLARHHIPFVVSPRFIPYGKDGPRPAPDNDLITSHYIPPADMIAIHRSFAPQPESR